jgi:hypothetical protein
MWCWTIGAEVRVAFNTSAFDPRASSVRAAVRVLT